MLSLHLFGGVSLESDDGPLRGPATQRHRLALLAVLAAVHPRGLLRDKLVGLLWPNRDEDHARNLLNQAVHAVRRALGDRAIVSYGSELRLNSAVVSCDLVTYMEAVEAGDKRRAAGLYRGPLLDGFYLPDAVEFEHWMAGERRRLDAAYRQLVEDLATEATEAGDLRQAVEWWRRLAVEDPYDARVAVELMRALESAGNRAAALEEAEAHTTRLAAELQAEPNPSVIALAERMRRAPRPNGASSPPEHIMPARDAGAVPALPRSPVSRPHRRATGIMVGLMAGAGILVLTAVLLGRRPSVHPSDNGGRIGESPPTKREAIAVLPFDNLTGRVADVPLALGLDDDLITALSTIGGLTVISRASVSAYGDRSRSPEDIGRELGVDLVVEGTMRVVGTSVHVTARLSQAASGQVIWARRYDGPLTLEAIFGIRAQIVQGIVSTLHLSLTEAELRRLSTPPTEDLTAYQYLQRAAAVFDGTQAANKESERLLRLALQKDPKFARAWATLAADYGWRPPYLGVPTSAWDSALLFAHRALEADPQSADGYTALALTYGHQGFLQRQEGMAREALRRNPNAALALRRLAESYRDRGDFPEALRHHLATVALSPNHLSYRSWVGYVHADLGDFPSAERWLDGVLELDPDNLAALTGEAVLFLQRGMPDSARQTAVVLMTRHSQETIALAAAAMVGLYLRDYGLAHRAAGEAVALASGAPARSANSPLVTTILGFACLQTGDTARAVDLFDQSLAFLEAWIAAGTDSPRWPYEVALIRAARGYPERALEGLERAYELGFRWPWMLEANPMLDPLRSDPRFEALVTHSRQDIEAMREQLQ